MEDSHVVEDRNCQEPCNVPNIVEKTREMDRIEKMEIKCTCSHGLRASKLLICSVIVLGILILATRTSAMPNAFLCHSCLHGGKLHVPDGPFAFCRCICPTGFVGLRCEFNQMYSGRRIRRVNRLKRLVKIRNDIQTMLSSKTRHGHLKRWKDIFRWSQIQKSQVRGYFMRWRRPCDTSAHQTWFEFLEYCYHNTWQVKDSAGSSQTHSHKAWRQMWGESGFYWTEVITAVFLIAKIDNSRNPLRLHIKRRQCLFTCIGLPLN